MGRIKTFLYPVITTILMEVLSELTCLPAEACNTALTLDRIMEYLESVPQWDLEDNKIARIFTFNTFKESVDFAHKVANLAEQEQHHPDILISYTKVKLLLSTHQVNGLTKNDFIVAAKIDRLLI